MKNNNETINAKLLEAIRGSELFGPASCSTIAECHTDAEILEDLAEFEGTPAQWLEIEIDVEEIHWENAGVYDWKRRNRQAIADLKKAFAAIK